MATRDDLKRLSLFKNLSDADLGNILPLCTEKQLKDGEVIYNCADKGTRFYILLDGDVRLQIPTEQGFGLTAFFVDAGDAFGISGLLEPHRYTSSAICTKSARVLAIDIGSFLKCITGENIRAGFEIMRNLAGILLERLSRTRQHLKSLVSQLDITIP